MKTIVAFIAVCFLITACNFSSGTRKDFVTGFSVTYNGFSIGEFGLVNGQNEQTKSNEVAIGNVIGLEVDGIENYQVKDEQVFPGLGLIVTGKDGTVILEGDDILGKESYNTDNASVMRGTITVGDPMKSGETYHVKMRIWDKLKPESEIIVEGDIVVK